MRARSTLLPIAVAAALLVALVPWPNGSEAQEPAPAPGPSVTAVEHRELGAIEWRRSLAVGLPHRGFLLRGVRLSINGADHFTWDPALDRVPNRGWRRWGTDLTVRRVLSVLAAFRAANPDAPRIAVGDLSRRNGGPFGKRFGGLGHASHQNGTDVDVYYPRLDRREWAPRKVSQIDRGLSQELVKRFVNAGAVYVFVGPRTGLRGRRGVVQRLVHHDDHMHVRFRKGG